MSAPMEFPLIYKLSMQDRGVKTGLQGIHQTLQKGGVATEAASKKMAHLETAISSQNRAIGLANTLWTTSHANLMSVGQALGAVGAMGTQLVSIFTMLNTQQSMMGDKRKALTEATEELERAERATLNALIEYGEGSKEHVENLEFENEVKSRLVDLNEDMVDSQKNVDAQNLAAGLTLMGTVAQGITLISVLGMMKNRAAFAGYGVIGLTVAAAALTVGLALGTSAVILNRQEGETWADTTTRMISEASNLPPGIREITQVFIAAGGGVMILAQAFFDVLATIGEFIVKAPIMIAKFAFDALKSFALFTIGAWVNMVRFVADGVKFFAEGFMKWLNNLAEMLKTGVKWLGEGLIHWANKIVEFIADVAVKVWEGAKYWGKRLWESLEGALKFILDLMPDWGKNIIRSLADGITAGISWVVDAVKR